MFDFLHKLRKLYGTLKTQAEIFSVPATSYDLSMCKFKSAEEPIEVAISHVAALYTNVSANTELLQGIKMIKNKKEKHEEVSIDVNEFEEKGKKVSLQLFVFFFQTSLKHCTRAFRGQTIRPWYPMSIPVWTTV